MTRNELQDVKPDLVCFSHLRWDFVFQRPQQILTRAANHYNIFFIEEPIFETDIVPHLEFRQRQCGVTVLVPKIPKSTPSVDAIQIMQSLIGLMFEKRALHNRVLWYYTPMALEFSRSLRADTVVYDNMDELSAFVGAPPALLQMEEELFRRADIVFTGGVSLYNAKRKLHDNVHAFPSSVDFHHFAQARVAADEPEDVRHIPGPRIGFFGVVDERMDIGLVGALAKLRPEWQFVIIGPVVKIDPATLPQAPNLHWLGSRPYTELPRYLSGWQAGFMPFALNESTRYISPTKTPEFLAAGVPTISTAITDVVQPYGRDGLVEIIHSAEEAACFLEVLLKRDRMPWLHKVDRHLARMSWDQTWSGMREVIRDHRSARLRPLPAARKIRSKTKVVQLGLVDTANV